jgi:uncharacterized membrane protein
LSSQEATRSPRRPRPRLESLSDLIYGLSLSIGAINLVITNSQTSTESEINKSILQFLFVFIILITSWIIYTSDMSVLPVETRLIQLLNVVLLMLVATIPYLFDQVVSPFNPSSVQDYASILFTADYAGTLVIMAVFSHIIAQEEEHLVDGEIMIRMRRVRNRLSLLTLIVLLSLAAPWGLLFLGVRVRLFIWLVPIASFWINRMRRSPFGLPTGGEARPGIFEREPGPAK